MKRKLERVLSKCDSDQTHGFSGNLKMRVASGYHHGSLLVYIISPWKQWDLRTYCHGERKMIPDTSKKDDSVRNVPPFVPCSRSRCDTIKRSLRRIDSSQGTCRRNHSRQPLLLPSPSTVMRGHKLSLRLGHAKYASTSVRPHTQRTRKRIT